MNSKLVFLWKIFGWTLCCITIYNELWGTRPAQQSIINRLRFFKLSTRGVYVCFFLCNQYCAHHQVYTFIKDIFPCEHLQNPRAWTDNTKKKNCNLETTLVRRQLTYRYWISKPIQGQNKTCHSISKTKANVLSFCIREWYKLKSLRSLIKLKLLLLSNRRKNFKLQNQMKMLVSLFLGVFDCSTVAATSKFVVSNITIDVVQIMYCEKQAKKTFWIDREKQQNSTIKKPLRIISSSREVILQVLRLLDEKKRKKKRK